MIVVNDADAHVAVPLVRVGSSECEVTVTLSTVDNLRAPGADATASSAIRTRVGARADVPRAWRVQAGRRRRRAQCEHHLPGGLRLAFVYVELLRKPTFKPRLRLRRIHCAAHLGLNNTATGPVHESVVRIVSAEHFPNASGASPLALSRARRRRSTS